MRRILNRVLGSKKPASSKFPTGRRQLGVELLEKRELMSGTGAQSFMRDIKPIYELFPAVGGGISGYSPAQIREAYGVNGISFNGANGDGSSQTIAIIDAYNDPNIFGDVNQFDQHFGVSASGATLYQQYGSSPSFLAVFNQNGQLINPSRTSVPVDSTGGWEGEESLDVEWAHAMAPGAKIDLIECNNSGNGLFTGALHAARLSGVSVVSMSWGGPESQNETSLDSTFTTPSGHQGVTFLASTGDASQGEYPAFSPNVIAVGGTTLTLDGSGNILSETGWSTGSDSWSATNGTGGGTSQFENEPAFQNSAQNTGMRTTPDVSFVADPATGVAIYDSFKQSAHWQQIGGTSLACPAWAGLFAIANQGRTAAGQATFNSSDPQEALTSLYNVSSNDFNDITSGSISANGSSYYAGPGYDEVTGLGTPVANMLIADLIGGGTTIQQSGPPAAPTFTANAVSGTEIDLAWGSVAGATSYQIDEWDSVNNVWTEIGTVAGSSTSYQVTGLSPDTTYYFDVAAVNNAGTTWAANYQQATTTGNNNVTIDHPWAAAGYTNVQGTLFGTNGPSYFDVRQGAIGDCWLLSSLAEVAARIPADIKSMFTYNGTTVENGTTVGLYTVRLFDMYGTAHYISVDTEFPAGGGMYDHPANGVLWVALAEKAYAEANGQGFVTTRFTGDDSYAALDEGQPMWALQAITGQSANTFAVNPSDIAAAWNAGELICIATSTPSSSYIVPSHAYAVVGYNPSSSMPFKVYNPWGTYSSGWSLGMYNGHKVYGLFNAGGGFLAQNFTSEAFGSGTENAASGNMQDLQSAVDLFFAAEQAHAADNKLADLLAATEGVL